MDEREQRFRISAVRDGRNANLALYAGGEEVRGYFTERYHAVRVLLARKQLGRALEKADFPAGAPVVELGAGGGRIVGGDRLLSVLGPRRVVYVDFDPAALGPVKLQQHRRVCSDAAATLPFRDATVCAVVLGELIEHIYDTRRLLEECHRILTPGGVVVLTTPNLAALQDRVRFIEGRSPRHVNPLHRYLWLHIRPFTATSLRDTLEATGFETIDLESNFVVWRKKSGDRLQSRSLARLFPGLGSILVACARRTERSSGP
ncbi:class I SAM-dependent methyltransferase [Nonomuraea sp. MCN248]|uniref:Class I SAM-dependent methyltransferase n=1 Tax=Nonomuraea corallina TaxID=2989783 RepID=A0ABT4S7Z2_9ACTN|nr:class I SAM-dependent methyltransferase [Nonomuraea corallina]MDA0633316.1 class I SAM-dependent methyltransferase [Nonomuraea corallina]